MQTAAGTQALIDLENRCPPWMFECFPGTNVRMWPFLRWPMAQSMADIELGQKTISAGISHRDRIVRTMGMFTPNSRSWRRAPEREVLFVVSGHRMARVSGRWKEWLVGDFASRQAARSVIIQDRPLARRSTADTGLPEFGDTFSSYDLALKSDILAKLRPLSASRRRRTIEFVNHAFGELDFTVDESRIAAATQKVLRNQGRLASAQEAFGAILDQVSPRVLILDGASYGGMRGLQTHLAKERGIRVSEPQHGWIGPSHGAYNFGAAMSDERLRSYVPDDLITFGKYWSEVIRTPSRTYPVGKAHLSNLATQAPLWSDREKAVLIASNSFQPAELIETARRIRDALPVDWQVVFRPHPSERNTTRYLALKAEDRIVIDPLPDVYASLMRVRGVFSYASTVLFESVALGCVPFVLDSPLADLYVTHDALRRRISDHATLKSAVDELVARTVDSPAQPANYPEIWHPDPLGAFDAYLDHTLGLAAEK